MPSDPEEPNANRQRLLSKTLNELCEGIIEAAEKGQWAGRSNWDHNNVLHLAKELIQVLTALKQDTDCTGLERLLSKVTKFMIDTLQNKATFEAVQHFQVFLKRWLSKALLKLEM